jgi:hypothetical protein
MCSDVCLGTYSASIHTVAEIQNLALAHCARRIFRPGRLREEVVTPETVVKRAMASKLNCYETRRLSLAMGP